MFTNSFGVMQILRSKSVCLYTNQLYQFWKQLKTLKGQGEKKHLELGEENIVQVQFKKKKNTIKLFHISIAFTCTQNNLIQSYWMYNFGISASLISHSNTSQIWVHSIHKPSKSSTSFPWLAPGSCLSLCSQTSFTPEAGARCYWTFLSWFITHTNFSTNLDTTPLTKSLLTEDSGTCNSRGFFSI